MYQKPICKCGQELKYCGIRAIVLVDLDITQKGQYSRKKEKGKWQIGNELEDPYLHCVTCDKTFKVDWDKKGRIIKGEEFNWSDQYNT